MTGDLGLASNIKKTLFSPVTSVLQPIDSVPSILPNVYLFINPNSGKPYLTDTLQRLWKQACKAVSVDIELYQATRHSVASMAASSGVSIAIIKEVLGHTDIRTTQKYSHVNVLSQSQVFAAQINKMKSFVERKNTL